MTILVRGGRWTYNEIPGAEEINLLEWTEKDEKGPHLAKADGEERRDQERTEPVTDGGQLASDAHVLR